MSQWTHVLGVIRYDYMAQNIWTSETNGRPKCYNPNEKIKLLNKLYKKDIPSGSEGPLQVHIHNSNRGPAVTITGDLRDFGKDEVLNIKYWLNNIDKEIKKYNEDKEFDDFLEIRDAIISCNVEYSDTVLFVYKDDSFKMEK